MQDKIEDVMAGIGIGLFVGLALFLVWCALTPVAAP